LRRAMRKDPKLDYLKGKEASALKGHFSGWTESERDTKHFSVSVRF
jgi:hypothetical protein